MPSESSRLNGSWNALASGGVVERVESYASLQSIIPEEVSHFAICVLAAGATDPDKFISDFPDLVGDSQLLESLRPEATEE